MVSNSRPNGLNKMPRAKMDDGDDDDEDVCVRKEMLQDVCFSRSLHHSPRGGNAPFAPAPPRGRPRTHTPAPPPTHPYQGWTKLNFESWGYYTLAKETKQTKMHSVPIHMCTLAMHLNVVLALWIRFSIFAAKLIHDRKSNNHYVLTFIISNFRIRKKLIVIKCCRESCLV